VGRAGGFPVWPMLNFAVYQRDEQDAQDDIESHEAEQREERIAGGDLLGVSGGGAHQAVDDPGLTTDLSGHPAGGGGDIGKRKAKHEGPENPAGGEEPVAPKQKAGKGHEADEVGAESSHDVVAVEK